ncbi:MAG TPA: acetate kinase, partial [Acidimicrobiales bacterium]|nr:acetate kinase [Acidimicrobiales bacterium]
RLAAKIAAMAAAARGLDAVVFTGGIGERSAAIRAETAGRLAWMGCSVDPAANEAAGSEDCDISAPGSRVASLVVHAREELVVAEACRTLLA